MKVNYIPILKAKDGEFDALSQLTPKQRRGILPFFEIPPFTSKIAEAARFRDVARIQTAYLEEVADKIASAWPKRRVLIDTFRWSAESTIETGEHVTSYLQRELESRGLTPIPLVGYDRWDSPAYRQVFQNIDLAANGCCIRLDSQAIEDAGDPEFFSERMREIIEPLSLANSDVGIILDFGDLSTKPLEQAMDEATAAIESLQGLGYKFIAIAGCSLPNSINLAVEKIDSTGRLLRKEALIWQSLVRTHAGEKWVFGDYGVRGPDSADDVVAPDANGKIRYTITNEYYIARGHSKRVGNKGAQMHDLAEVIARSIYYMGPGFSWGDERIMACSNREFKGNASQWIAIDTNHHLNWVPKEIEEVVAKVRASGVQFVDLEI